jgi:predicted branched-subunit amino acid permease
LRQHLPRFNAGLIDALAFLPSVALLGVIFGASARTAQISPGLAIAMSLFVWSGTGQFAALAVWQSSAIVTVMGTLALSLRFSLMTASMLPRLRGMPASVRAMLAFTITDENYALAVTRLGGEMEPAYLAGSFIPLYVPWVVGTAAGALFAPSIPAGWSGPLNSVFPIVFLTLAVLCANTKPAAVVAVLGAALAVVGRSYLPGGWHVVAAGLLASLAGPLVEHLLAKEAKS